MADPKPTDPKPWYTSGRVWAWVFVGVAVIVGAVVAVLFTVVLGKPKLTSIMVNGGTPTAAKFTNGTVLTLSYTGQDISHVIWSYSVDSGVTFRTIVNGSTAKSQVWTLPPEMYTNNCVVRVADASAPESRYLDTPRFTVTPQVTLMSGMRQNESYVVFSQVKLPFESNTTLLNDKNLRLLSSPDGATFSLVETTYTAVCSRGYVMVYIPLLMSGQSLYFRITTSDLLAAGYPTELSSTTINPLLFKELTNSSSAAGVTFATFSLFGNDEYTEFLGNIGGADGVGWLTYGQTLYMQFTLVNGASPLTSQDIKFQYQLGGANGAWQDMDGVAVVDKSLNAYSWVIKTHAYEGVVTFRVIQTNSAITPPPSIAVTDLNISAFYHVPNTVQNNGNRSFIITIYSPALANEATPWTNWTIKTRSAATSQEITEMTTYDTTSLTNYMSMRTSGSAVIITLQNLTNMSDIATVQLTHNGVSTKLITIPH